MNVSDAIDSTILFEPLLNQLNHALQIGITRTEPARQPVSLSLGDSPAIGNHLKLTDVTGSNNGGNTEALLYEGHETRDLSFVVLSGRTGDYLNVHYVLQSARPLTRRSDNPFLSLFQVSKRNTS